MYRGRGWHETVLRNYEDFCYCLKTSGKDCRPFFHALAHGQKQMILRAICYIGLDQYSEKSIENDMFHFSNLQVKGKIVVFNEKWVDYDTTVSYRNYGASRVAKLGGLASLIRSVTPFSIYSPHTGWQDYEKGK